MRSTMALRCKNALRRGELDSVKDAVKERREELKKKVAPPRVLNEEDKVALAKGNSKAMIRANKEVFDYSGVGEKDLLFEPRVSMRLNPLQEKANAYIWLPSISGASGMRWIGPATRGLSSWRRRLGRAFLRGGGGGGGGRGDDGGDGGGAR